jgi:two-component system chemotaxis sensor kinase CheA
MEKKSQTYSKKDKLNIILMAGFSTKKVATEFSGRGVGMDVVKSNIEKLKGTIEIDSAPGEGTVFKLSIPYQKD